LDPWPLDEVSRPKIGQLKLNLHGTILEGKSIGLDPKKKELKGELMIWRMKVKARVQLASNQFASNESKLVPKNLNPAPI
jgi:hypothetical protein